MKNLLHIMLSYHAIHYAIRMVWTHSSRAANGQQDLNTSASTKEQLYSYLYSHTESKRNAREVQVSAREVLQKLTSKDLTNLTTLLYGFKQKTLMLQELWLNKLQCQDPT